MLRAKDVVLLVLDAYGGSLEGKTLLQKICYFVDVFLSADLGYRAHYFGPYSPAIEEAVGELKSLGFIGEDTVGFGVTNPSGFGELRRYDYRLTDDGKQVVQEIKARQPVDSARVATVVRKIRACGDPDYLELSVAAKSFFIMKKHDKPITVSELRSEAAKLDWQLPPQAVENALALLRQLDLVSH